VLEDAIREEFGLRAVRGFEIEHTHKLGNPLVRGNDGRYPMIAGLVYGVGQAAGMDPAHN